MKRNFIKKNFIAKKMCRAFFALSVFMFLGCENSLFENPFFENSLMEFLQRDTSDPSCSTCSVDCFSNVGVIYLSWKKDECADSYILYRALNNTEAENLDFIKIYEGNSCDFEDSSVETGCLYRYRLDKVRGQKVFEGNKTSLAVATTIPMDLSTGGDSKENAISLEYKCHSCCYYYKFDSETEFKNVIWYKVKIPAMKKAAIIVDETNSDYFQYIKQNSTCATNIVPKQEFYLENDSYTEKEIYFLIQANPESFASSNVGGDIRSFKIELNKIEAQ